MMLAAADSNFGHAFSYLEPSDIDLLNFKKFCKQKGR